MARKTFSDAQLARIRALPLIAVLDSLQAEGKLFWRFDEDFVPEKDKRTVRLFISSPAGSAWEVLVTGSKWYDGRGGKGGGGGIDLMMYLLGVDFVTAVTCLLTLV